MRILLLHPNYHSGRLSSVNMGHPSNRLCDDDVAIVCHDDRLPCVIKRYPQLTWHVRLELIAVVHLG